MDCIVGKDAYEFKLRVTIAASGQGRFGEELAFARDCAASTYTPNLLVLDPTPSARLDDLAAEYVKYGGRAFIGDDAWHHLEDESGPTMAVFIERYIRRPIASLDASADGLLALGMAMDAESSRLRITLGTGEQAHAWTVTRSEDISLLDLEDEAGT